MDSNPLAQRHIRRLRDGASEPQEDLLAVEEPLEIRVGDQSIAVTMRTPGHDRDLAAGFCLTEGIIEHADELETVEPCNLADYGNVVVVRLADEAAARRQQCVTGAQRDLYLSSSCGLCGKRSIDRIRQRMPALDGPWTIPPAALLPLPQVMRAAQATFDRTGGLHAAGLFDLEGRLRLLREDVGRHNAVDKIVGAMLLSGMIPARRVLLLVSGRASFEIMQKAAMAGIAMVAAVGAPSSLAVDFAVELGLTLVGFLRDSRMNIYHDRGRITA